MITVGTQFICTKASRSLRINQKYYFAGARPNQTILLVWFHKSSNTWKPYTLELMSSDMQDLIQCGSLSIVREQCSMPQWLEKANGLNFEELEDLRVGRTRQTYREYVNHRVQFIAEAAENYKTILASANPNSELSYYRRKSANNVNRGRYRLWFWTFVLHGFNCWSLAPAFMECGTWLRTTEKHKERKFGRPSKSPTCFTSPGHLCHELSIKGFLKFHGQYKTIHEIYEKTLTKVFKVIKVKDDLTGFYYTHPKNLPFPSIAQFRKCVIKELGIDGYHRKLYGSKHLRRNAKYNQGSFLSAHLNILDELIADAFTVEQIPVRFDERGPADLLYCVRGRCATTGAIVGIGFSQGTENADAYRSMLFCCTAPRELIARLYGLSIDVVEQWITRGLSPSYQTDRGPGAAIRIEDSAGRSHLARKTIVPSGDGQGNAISEASHPRERLIQGYEQRPLSSLNVIEMMKKEIIRCISDNDSRDVTDRLSDQAVQDFFRNRRAATPNNYWKYLESMFCTNALDLDVSHAIRTFLKEIVFVLDRNGLRLNERIYGSDAFANTHFFKHAPRGLTLKGYVVPCAIRVAWVEVNGKLIEVERKSTLRSQSDANNLSLEDSVQLANQRKTLKSAARHQASAAQSYHRSVFEKETGREWEDNLKSPNNKRIKRTRNTIDKSILNSASGKGT